MSPLALPLLVFILGVVILCRRYIKRRIARYSAASEEQFTGDRCACGYPLKNLERARCPECGRVVTFNATAEQLGLTPEQLERVQRKRDEREKAK